MSVSQVVTRQIHRCMVHRVNEVGLHHGIVGMLHRIGCVDYIHLETIENKNRHLYGPKMRLMYYSSFITNAYITFLCCEYVTNM